MACYKPVRYIKYTNTRNFYCNAFTTVQYTQYSINLPRFFFFKHTALLVALRKRHLRQSSRIHFSQLAPEKPGMHTHFPVSSVHAPPLRQLQDREVLSHFPLLFV